MKAKKSIVLTMLVAALCVSMFSTSVQASVSNREADDMKLYISALGTRKTVGHFTDVSEDDWFAQSVQWAVENSITVGTSGTTFSPNETCTNAQILTFLWRAIGSPEVYISNPFTDLKNSDYFYKPALWAYRNGLVTGKVFGGDTPCTRASTVSFLWRLAGQPLQGRNPFFDISSSADYAQAVMWAVEQGITSGTSATTFSPSIICTRGHIVTFLYRFMQFKPQERWENFLSSKSYLNFLSDNSLNPNLYEYSIFDINNDGTLELLMQQTEYHDGWYQTFVFSYYNCNIIKVYSCYGYGSFRYSPNHNAIIVSPEIRPNAYAGSYSFYQLSENHFDWLFSVGSDELQSFYRNESETLYISDETRSEYFYDAVRFEWRSVYPSI